MGLLSRINQLIAAQAVFVLARVIQAPDESLVGVRLLVTAEGAVRREGPAVPSAAEPTPELRLIESKATELLARERAPVRTLWYHGDGVWNERKHGAQFGALFEIVRPQPELLICGAGHVGHATARLGVFLDYKVTLVDERAEFACRERVPEPAIELIARPFDEALRDFPVTAVTSIVIVTRGHAQDETCLREVLRSRAGYIGMIGSKRRVGGIFERLLRDGFTREETERVHAPIGLRIGARTPEEIAVAILAEIIAVRNPEKG